MNIYGDGSDGALNVLSGSQSIALNHKHQFSSVNIAAGATLTTGSVSGAVLYILCNGTFTLNGTIDVSNKVDYGNNTWGITLDGDSYSSPGVANGAVGGSTPGASGGAQSNGFGGGGAGGSFTGDDPSHTGINGGAGGSGATPFGTPGSSVNRQSSTPDAVSSGNGNAGSGSAGGSGGALAYWRRTSGNITLNASATGGGGAGSYGSNGGSGSVFHSYISGSGGYFTATNAGGGGGGGGRAGRAGVHIVIKAKTLVLNGTIITSGSNGGNGGNGGDGFSGASGGGGGGGGGGNAGDIHLVFSESLSDSSTKTQSGGGGGSGGTSLDGAGLYGGSGSAGSSGTNDSQRVVDLEGSVSGGGEAILEFESATYHAIGGGLAIGRGYYSTIFQALPQKDYEYRVFDHAGNYIGTWQNVISDFGYQQTINQTPSELTVDIARAPDNVIVKIEGLDDGSGNPILDENSDPILVQTETANAVGEETDVDLNYNVDVYAFYGGYEALLDEFGNEILDENNSAILTQYGAPNGKRVYSGYIGDYELVYGKQTGVKVTIIPHAAEMSHYIFKDPGGDTTVGYSSIDPVVMARDAMDSYNDQGGIITYTTDTMPLSGEVSSYDFKLQTTRESVDKTVDLLPSGYYHFVDPGQNIQYLLQRGSTADHTFYYEKHITELVLKKSITQLKNKVYFVGGDTGSGDLFKYYEDSTSITALRPGLERLSDSRVTLASSAAILSEREIAEFKNPRYRTSVTITDAVYDIESIQLGHMIGFKNFGTFVDSLVLQVVSYDKSKHSIRLDLDMTLPGEAKRLEDLKRSILAEQIRNIGAAPS